MNDDQERAAKYRVIAEAKAARELEASLRSQLEASSKTLESAKLHINGVLQGLDYPDLYSALAGIPDRDVVLRLMNEFRDTVKRAKDLKQQADKLI